MATILKDWFLTQLKKIRAYLKNRFRDENFNISWSVGQRLIRLWRKNFEKQGGISVILRRVLKNLQPEFRICHPAGDLLKG
jgi:hypothetical protein